ncbi:hypothetical protein [Clostridium botulinum]|uniref:hypothetical protein n=1 Tax=Clostridium botulinum TaxID=1491 RepID=UPI001C9B48E3|nr:hypothetical protein [Clostridium botulinum]MBY6842627.1 hypothetical protein [Clostridium botulinum]
MNNTKEFAVSRDIEVTISKEDDVTFSTKSSMRTKEFYSFYEINLIKKFADLVIENNDIIKNRGGDNNCINDINVINKVVIINGSKINILCNYGSDTIFFKQLLENLKNIQHDDEEEDSEEYEYITHPKTKQFIINVQTLS